MRVGCVVRLGKVETDGGGAVPVVAVVVLVRRKAGSREGRSRKALVHGHGVLQHGNREMERDW